MGTLLFYFQEYECISWHFKAAKQANVQFSGHCSWFYTNHCNDKAIFFGVLEGNVPGIWLKAFFLDWRDLKHLDL